MLKRTKIETKGLYHTLTTPTPQYKDVLIERRFRFLPGAKTRAINRALFRDLNLAEYHIRALIHETQQAVGHSGYGLQGHSRPDLFNILKQALDFLQDRRNGPTVAP